METNTESNNSKIESKNNEDKKELPKKYNPAESEIKWQKFWEENNIYAFDTENSEKIYSIDTPPPTVSGKMHLGHAFGNSQQDFIARYKRMKGYNVLQPFGTDDNGLPTKLLVEKLKKIKPGSMNKKEFRELCLKTITQELKPSYTQDWKRLGISCDFNVNYSTIDPHCQKISQKSFIDLYKKGREYRAEAPAMYCPKCMTAISQVECEDKDIDSFFNDIVFKVDEEELIIATTRPELLPACVAVFYHPEDKRYHHLKGKKARVPLFNLEVPILEDERADPEKGTGIVMCCTFGDQTDMEWQKIHNLPIREAIGRDGRMTVLAEKYQGLKIEQARKQIIDDMKSQDLLRNQKPIKHAVNVHERCGTPIEFVHSKQWFIKYLDLKDEMFKWGSEVDWHPAHMKNRFDNWVNGLAWDWCISRQLPFGIPFPVWYCKDCDEIILAEEKDLPVDPIVDFPKLGKCPKCGCTEFVPETDVLNTWATSSLTPTIVKELFKGKAVYQYLIDNPMSLRPQGHDIISFWLFNTVVKSNFHFNMKPWDVCFINGWMLDPNGKKMSKSKGNVIEPQKIIDKYSADALRYMSASSKLGEDLAFPEKDIITGKKTITKLWNASRFVIMNLQDYLPKEIHFEKLSNIDKWLISRLHDVIKSATAEFDNYEFSKAKAFVDNFFWNTFCDYYLEMVKDKVFNAEVYNKEELESFRYTLYTALLSILKMFSPFTPFITEEIYQMFYKDFEGKKSIHITNWPEYSAENRDEKIENAGDLAVKVIANIRKYKSDNKMSLNEELDNVIITCSAEEKDLILLLETTIKSTAKLKNIDFKYGEFAVGF